MTFKKIAIGLFGIPAMLVVLLLASVAWLVGATGFLIAGVCIIGWEGSREMLTETMRKIIAACELD